MLIALLADINANYHALTAVVEHARRYDSRVVFWCLGDVFGRGPAPLETWNMLTVTVRPQYWLAGNHDWGLAGLIGENEFGNQAEWEALVRQKEFLTAAGLYPTVQATIRAMPVMLSPFEGVYLAHGSFGVHQTTPWECITEYLFRCVQIEKTWHTLRAFVTAPTPQDGLLALTERWTPPMLMLVGHTHQRNLVWLNPRCRQETIEIGRWYELARDAEQPVLVNPGSVGFPRELNADYCASYALLDWDACRPRIAFQRVPYDRSATRRWMDERVFPQKIKQELGQRCHFAYVNNCLCKEFL